MNSDSTPASADAVSAESVSPVSPSTATAPAADSPGADTGAAQTGAAASPAEAAAAEPPLRRLVQEGAKKVQGGERPATGQRGEGPRGGPGARPGGGPRGGGSRGGGPRGGGPRGGGPRGGGPRSRREGSDADSPEALLDEAASPERPRAKVPPPSRRQPLSPDLEQEMESALAGMSMEDLVSGGLAAAAVGSGIELDARYRAIVVKIHGDDVFFALDGRNEGVASLRQFRDPPQLGMEMEVVVSRYNADDGIYELRVPGAAMDVEDWSDLVEGAVVEARVTGSNVGGLECMVGHIRGFIPASQVEMFRVENFADYYEKKLPCVVTEANERRRNLVLSHRALMDREKEEQRRELLEALQVGDVREGVVTNVRDFGAFVDLGGLEGLIHISQLSWDRIAHPSEVLQPGQKIRVKVEKIHHETGKIGLNYRDLLDHPWTDIDTRFPVDSLVKGVVTRTAKFGAFVKLAPGIEGLIHISELAHHRVLQVSNVVREGDEVEVKILSVDAESQRISLSLKDAHPLPEAAPAESAEAVEADEPLRKPVVRPSGKPLKGGTAQESGGEQFGLTW